MRELLEPLAPEVDVDEGWRQVQRRLRRPGNGRTARVLAVAAAFALVAGGIVLANRGGDGEDTDPAGPVAPEGGQPEPDVQDGISLSLPDDWQVAGQLVPSGSGLLQQRFAIATYELRSGGGVCGDWPVQAVRDLGPTDALIWVSVATLPTVNAPARPVYDDLPPVVDGSCDQVDVEAHRDTFRDEDGRVLGVGAVLGADVAPARRAEAIAILNDFRVDVVEAEPPTAPANGAVSVDVQPGWERSVSVLTPDLEDPEEMLAIGTFDLPVNGPQDCAHVPSAALRLLASPGYGQHAFVWIGRRAEPSPEVPSLDDFVLPEGLDGDPEVASCGGSGGTSQLPYGDWTENGPAFEQGTYQRDGTTLEVLVALGANATEETRAEMQAVLDSIHVDPALVTHRGQRFLVEHPTTWQVAESFNQLVVGTAALPDQCPAGADCICAWPELGLNDLGAVDVLLWFEVSPAPAVDFRPRSVVTQLPVAPVDRCGSAETEVREYLFPERGSRALAVRIATGPDVSDEALDEALAIVNSVAYEPPA